MRVRTAIADSGAVSTRGIAGDLDYLAARLHGRRSRMAEAERLDRLCRIRSLPEFVRTVFFESELKDAAAFQRHAVLELVRELSGLIAYVPEPGASLLDWALVRFQVENIKVLMRICITKAPVVDLQRYIVPLPEDLMLDAKEMAAAESIEGFVGLIPRGLLRDHLKRSPGTRERLWAALLLRSGPGPGLFPGIDGEDRGTLWGRSGMRQGNDLPGSGYLPPDAGGPGKIPVWLDAGDAAAHCMWAGTRIPLTLFAEMLSDVDLPTTVARVLGRALDQAPFGSESGDASQPKVVDGAAVERLAWKRFLRLSNLAFRRSHMGLGAIVGYWGLRRVETANLITISEGIEKGTEAADDPRAFDLQHRCRGGLCLGRCP